MKITEGSVVVFQADHKIRSKEERIGTVVNKKGNALTVLDKDGYIYEVVEHDCYLDQKEAQDEA